MKKIIIGFLAMTLTGITFSQDVEHAPVTPIDLLKKAKSQKTGGWILSSLGAGGLLGTLVAEGVNDVGGAFVTVISGGSVRPERRSYTVLYVASAGVLAGGIALLSASSRTKRRLDAVSHFINMERTEVLGQSGSRQHVLPVAGIRVAL